MNQSRIDFLEFLESLALNSCSYESWKKFAQTHYLDEGMEKARVRLVQICNEDDSIGNKLWPLTDDAIVKIKDLIIELREDRDS